jgi:hypothetical protein
VSAEEAVEAAAPAEPPWWTRPATDARKRDLLDATAEIIGDRDLARDLLKGIGDTLGVMPDVLPAFAKALNGTVQANEPKSAPEGEGA